MRKIMVIFYLTVSIGLMLTVATYLTWSSSCQIATLIPEGTNYSGACANDGRGFIGVFLESLVIALIYLGLTKFILKLLGYKLIKK